MKKIKNICCLILLVLCTGFSSLFSQSGDDKMLLIGSETLLQFGIDTTGNWWAVTQPYTDQYRAIINGNESIPYRELTGLKFSSSGSRWAFFGYDNSGWNVVANDTVINLNASKVGELHFASINSKLSYSYTDAGTEYIIINGNRISTYSRVGEYYINSLGNRYAYVSSRGNSFVININGKETQTFDQVLPIGFWHNGQFLYAGRMGSSWEIYKNEEAITEMYKSVSEVVINNNGTVAAALVQLNSDYYQSILFSDEYIEPLFSGQYDAMRNLCIHPYEPLIGCNAELNTGYYVLLNSTEYSAEEFSGKPAFTYDGSELYFITCRISCYISINGKKIKIPNQLDTDAPYVKKPNNMTICYPTSSTLIVQNIETNDLFGTLLIDDIANPIYNYRTGSYETVASIGNRLYLLSIKP